MVGGGGRPWREDCDRLVVGVLVGFFYLLGVAVGWVVSTAISAGEKGQEKEKPPHH